MRKKGKYDDIVDPLYQITDSCEYIRDIPDSIRRLSENNTRDQVIRMVMVLENINKNLERIANKLEERK